MTQRQRTVMLIERADRLTVQQLLEGMSALGLPEFSDLGECFTFTDNMRRATRNGVEYLVLDHKFPVATAEYLKRTFDPPLEERATQAATITALSAKVVEMRDQGATRRELLRPVGALRTAQAMRAAAQAAVVWLSHSPAPLERLFEVRAEAGWVLLPAVELAPLAAAA
jgi:uncharacterized coiled-coil protein SlyX